MLKPEDPATLLIVRRINKLGFKAERALLKYFTTYGPVKKVLLAHSTVRLYNGSNVMEIKQRPSNMAFIQMSSAEVVLRILALGDTHQVEGTQIGVQRFEQQDKDHRDAEAVDDDVDEHEVCKSDQAAPVQFKTDLYRGGAASSTGKASSTGSESSQGSSGGTTRANTRTTNSNSSAEHRQEKSVSPDRSDES